MSITNSLIFRIYFAVQTEGGQYISNITVLLLLSIVIYNALVHSIRILIKYLIVNSVCNKKL